MQTIYLVTTGGTIGKEYSEQPGLILTSSGNVKGQRRRLPLPDCVVRVISMMKEEGQEMTSEDRAALVSEVGKLLPQQCPIVITHQTDPVVETGALIRSSFPDLSVAVILTRAMRRPGSDGSEGLENLAESIFAALTLGPGVYAALHSLESPAALDGEDEGWGTFIRVDARAGLARCSDDRHSCS
jgi:L-asparaginase/Glu-tRNA(Gln) amidotransferase subunit D